MKIIGAMLLVVGLLMGLYSFSMEVTVDVPEANYGSGITTPASKVVNINLLNERQNVLIFSGILAIVGAVLFGFGTKTTSNSSNLVEKKEEEQKVPLPKLHTTKREVVTSVTICPKCRHMEAGDIAECPKCGAVITA